MAFFFEILFLFVFSFSSFAQKTTEIGPTDEGTVECKKLVYTKWQRTKELPKRLTVMRDLINQEVTEQAFLENVRAFWGSYQLPEERKYQMRPWNKVNMASVDDSQIVGMPKEEFLAILQLAMEIEDPILSYQAESGKAFEVLLPSLARFMGRTPRQQAFAEEQNKQKSCGTVWCSEENRHGNMYAKLIERLTGQKVDRSNATYATVTNGDEKGSLRHLSHRQGTEWGASSAYFILATHSIGPLQQVILNVIRDELKHLASVSAADVYLRGHVKWSRTIRMLEKTWIEYRVESKERTDGSEVMNNPFGLAEVLWAHYQIEKRVRGFLKKLPFKTLQTVFDSKTKLDPLPEQTLASQEEKLIHQSQIENSARTRYMMARWPTKQRKAVYAQVHFEDEHKELIQKIVRRSFRNFVFADEDPVVAEAYRLEIDRLPYSEFFSSKKDQRKLKKALHDALIHYRIIGKNWFEEVSA
ncbi:MAG: hypothetical protein AB7F43_06030 [Bacteriovoracia bacterium]